MSLNNYHRGAKYVAKQETNPNIVLYIIEQIRLLVICWYTTLINLLIHLGIGRFE